MLFLSFHLNEIDDHRARNLVKILSIAFSLLAKACHIHVSFGMCLHAMYW